VPKSSLLPILKNVIMGVVLHVLMVQDDPRLLGDSGGIPIPEGLAVRFSMWNLFSTWRGGTN
jgi:hypothetical protein